MDVICYLCNTKTNEWRENLVGLHSKYTKTSISCFVKRFLSGFGTQRNIEDPLNRMCLKCLNNINDYDLMLMAIARKESELRKLLLVTERHFNHHQVELEPELDQSIIEQEAPQKSMNLSRDISVQGRSKKIPGKIKKTTTSLKPPSSARAGKAQTIKAIYMKQFTNSQETQTDNTVKLRAPPEQRTRCIQCNDGVWYNRSEYKVCYYR